MAIHAGDGEVQLRDLLGQRRAGRLKFGRDRSPRLVRKRAGRAGAEPSAGALDQAAQRVDQHGAGAHQRAARVDQVQVLLASRAALGCVWQPTQRRRKI